MGPRKYEYSLPERALLQFDRQLADDNTVAEGTVAPAVRFVFVASPLAPASGHLARGHDFIGVNFQRWVGIVDRSLPDEKHAKLAVWRQHERGLQNSAQTYHDRHYTVSESYSTGVVRAAVERFAQGQPAQDQPTIRSRSNLLPGHATRHSRRRRQPDDFMNSIHSAIRPRPTIDVSRQLPKIMIQSNAIATPFGPRASLINTCFMSRPTFTSILRNRARMNRTVIGDVELVLSEPVEQEIEWIGQKALIDQVLASWLGVHEKDLPLCPRLVGKPGVGKTTLGYAAARAAELPAYIHQCTMDTRPEDLLVTPVLSRSGTISYHASPLVSAMIQGGVAILDEANRMSEKSWASLAPLFDHRRYVESVVAGIRIPAHPQFRACVTMNDDASTFEVPDYMLSRIQPSISIDFPEREEEMRILRYHLPFATEEIVKLTVDFLQDGHKYGLPYSTRDGINIARYACKIASRDSKPSDPIDWQSLFQQVATSILGEDATDFKKQSLKSNTPSYLDLQEFFQTLEESAEDAEGDCED